MLMLWIGILGGPLIWLSILQIQFMLVPWACGAGWTPALHVTSVLALALAAAAIWIAHRCWIRTGREWPGEEDGSLERSRMMAVVGMLVSSLSFLVILAQWITNILMNPCQ